MSLRRQAASLAVMHAAEVVQPLLLMPYAARVLGAQGFGVYAYTMAVGQFAATFVEYGFHWSAQRDAGVARHEPANVARLFAHVLLTKTVLFMLVTATGFVVAPAVFGVSPGLFGCAMLSAFGNILFPIWLLIGLERTRLAATAVVVARVAACLAFVLLVRSPEDVAYAVLAQSAVPLVAGLVTLPRIRAICVAGLRSLRFRGVLIQLRLGAPSFLYALVERLLMTLPMMAVQHWGGYVAAGHYSLAERFVNAARPFFRLLSETLLPRVAFYARHQPAAGLRLVWLSLGSLGLGLGLSLGLLFVAPLIIVPIFGEPFADAIPIVRLLAVIPLLLNVNACTSNLFMFNFGYERAWIVLNVASLGVFVLATFTLLQVLASAASAVSLAVVAKEALVALVSASFLVAFTLGERRQLARRGVDENRPAGSADPALVRAVRTSSAS